MTGRCRRQLVKIAIFEANPKSQASVGHGKFHATREQAFQQSCEEIPPLAIELHDLACVTVQFAGIDQFGHRAFGRGVALAVDHPDVPGRPVDEGLGAHQIAQPQAGAEDLGEGTDIDDFARHVGAGKRQHGLM